MAYLVWNTKTIQDFSDSNISKMYEGGYVFTRKGKGIMNKTRSLRIDLSKFSTHTKNKRVLRKTQNLLLEPIKLPIPIEQYDWSIHKLGKGYYEKKFGSSIFTASKIKELIIDNSKSNFNLLFKYTEEGQTVGYTITYQNSDMLHYAYPFYDLDKYFNHYGMGMMLRAIIFAHESNRKYFYLGSVSRPADIYKLYFRGLEWFDGTSWNSDIEAVKKIVESIQ